MEKVIHLLRTRPSQGRSELAEAVMGAMAAIEATGGSDTTVHLVDDTVTIDGPMPCPDGELPLRAAVSTWVAAHDLSDVAAVLEPLAERCDGYLVTEAVYSEYGQRRGELRDWPAGERTPGICTVAVVARNPALDHRTFRELWYGRQSPMSEAAQPRLRYVRNTVVDPITPGAAPLDGIVMESWPSQDVVDDLIAFHNDDAENLTVMMDTVSRLFDMSSLRSVAMAEYLMH
ncbi:MAG: hypothetical protein GY812_10800 [Actinomycetia bacterium]|nr:hypothetical protein [Actinomycetes bacterium]